MVTNVTAASEILQFWIPLYASRPSTQLFCFSLLSAGDRNFLRAGKTCSCWRWSQGRQQERRCSFKRHRNLYNTAVRQSKAQYFESHLASHSKDPKKTCKILKEATNLNTVQSTITELNVNGTSTSKSSDIATVPSSPLQALPYLKLLGSYPLCSKLTRSFLYINLVIKLTQTTKDQSHLSMISLKSLKKWSMLS